MSIRQGLIWILIAAISEIPTVVRLAFLLNRSFLFIMSQVFMILDLNGIFHSRNHRGQVLIELYSDKTASAPQSRTFLLAASGEGYVTDFLCVSTTQMFQNPCMIVLAIAATRMYRSLAKFCSTDM
jgi:hypothetical protein